MFTNTDKIKNFPQTNAAPQIKTVSPIEKVMTVVAVRQKLDGIMTINNNGNQKLAEIVAGLITGETNQVIFMGQLADKVRNTETVEFDQHVSFWLVGGLLKKHLSAGDWMSYQWFCMSKHTITVDLRRSYVVVTSWNGAKKVFCPALEFYTELLSLENLIKVIDQ
jgi:hypothetical protein